MAWCHFLYCTFFAQILRNFSYDAALQEQLSTHGADCEWEPCETSPTSVPGYPRHPTSPTWTMVQARLGRTEGRVDVGLVGCLKCHLWETWTAASMSSSAHKCPKTSRTSYQSHIYSLCPAHCPIPDVLDTRDACWQTSQRRQLSFLLAFYILIFCSHMTLDRVGVLKHA